MKETARKWKGGPLYFMGDFNMRENGMEELVKELNKEGKENWKKGCRKVWKL